MLTLAGGVIISGLAAHDSRGVEKGAVGTTRGGLLPFQMRVVGIIPQQCFLHAYMLVLSPTWLAFPSPVFVGVVTDLAGIPLTTGTRVKVVGWRDIFWQPSVYQKKNMLFACIHNVVLHWSYIKLLSHIIIMQ